MALGTVHGGYMTITSSDIDAAVLADMGGSVNFWMIPTEHLPMLSGMWDTPFETWLDPTLRPIIDSAYDTLTHGAEVLDTVADVINFA